MEKNYIVEGVVAHNFTHFFKLRSFLSKYFVDLFLVQDNDSEHVEEKSNSS